MDDALEEVGSLPNSSSSPRSSFIVPSCFRTQANRSQSEAIASLVLSALSPLIVNAARAAKWPELSVWPEWADVPPFKTHHLAAKTAANCCDSSNDSLMVSSLSKLPWPSITYPRQNFPKSPERSLCSSLRAERESKIRLSA